MRPRDGNVTARCRRGAAGGTGGAGSRFQISLLWRRRRINVDNTEFSTFSTGFSTGTFLNGFYRTFAYLLDITRIPFPLATLHFLHFRNFYHRHFDGEKIVLDKELRFVTGCENG